MSRWTKWCVVACAATLLGVAAAAPSMRQTGLVAPDGAAQDGFGGALALNAEFALIGAPGRDGKKGAVYAFPRSGKGFGPPTMLVAPDGSDSRWFGGDVAVSGTRVLIGAGHASGTLGAAYVFRWSGTNWLQEAKLVSGEEDTDGFGGPVAIDGDTALVGAVDQDGSEAGAAYVFRRDGTTWTQEAKLVASDRVRWDLVYSVALVGDTAFLGVPFRRNSGADGAVYVFTRTGSTWAQRATITPDDSDVWFGTSIAASGDTLLVQASVYPKDDLPWGNGAYAFTGAGANWTKQGVLLPSDDGWGVDWNGRGLALDGDTAVVGEWSHLAYYFTRSAGTWTQRAVLTPTNGVLGDDFGVSAALFDGTALVGAPDAGAGAVTAFAGLPTPPPDADLSGVWTGKWRRKSPSPTKAGRAKSRVDQVTLTITQTGRDLSAEASITSPGGGTLRFTLRGDVGNRCFWMGASDPDDVAPLVLTGKVTVRRNGRLRLKGGGLIGTQDERGQITSLVLHRER